MSWWATGERSGGVNSITIVQNLTLLVHKVDAVHVSEASVHGTDSVADGCRERDQTGARDVDQRRTTRCIPIVAPPLCRAFIISFLS